MKRHGWLFLGVLAATAIGLTTDQIIQNVYDPVNQAIRLNAVIGGGGGNTPTPAPTATPQPTVTPVPTATPQATPTPISPQYRSVIFTGSGTTTNLTNSGNNFMALGTSFASSTTESARSGPYILAVTVKNLSCHWGIAPLSTTSWAATIRSGTCGSSLSDSSLTCTLTGNGSATTCTDGSHSLAISANQCASLNVVGTNSPLAAVVYCSVEADY